MLTVLKIMPNITPKSRGLSLLLPELLECYVTSGTTISDGPASGTELSDSRLFCFILTGLKGARCLFVLVYMLCSAVLSDCEKTIRQFTHLNKSSTIICQNSGHIVHTIALGRTLAWRNPSTAASKY